MKITGIKQQLKLTNRYSVFIDEKYSFSLSEAALLQSGIASGQQLDTGQVDAYKQLSSDDTLFNRALRYVAMRPRSVWEIKTYLQRKEAAEPAIDDIIMRLTELELLSDAKYASNFVHNRQLLRPTSRRKLELELKKKRIADQHIRAALDELESNDSDSIQAVITKMRRQSKYQDDMKLMQYLVRQGYNYGIVKAALRADDEDY